MATTLYTVYPGQALRATVNFGYAGPAVSLALNVHMMLFGVEKLYKQNMISVPGSFGIGVTQQVAFTHDEIIASGANGETTQLRARVYVYSGGWVLLKEAWSEPLVAFARTYVF